ncbi:bifunctional 4-hydroxy-3-methylbut-2-enyl diphosphate reductase/30S ribosomal protein S1 [Tissierella sp. Yu-01]|uniref:bifunctional 4-hydroxy-3-methylbut-2-enyl diphosphate reductase/30S ribosomal protein S1 n=1 Tax=Tissierella sp. Yu-01 TaxID=3035694 RepID=UPI00240E09F4|nr:bifunctional 4-hydroxy-3-methylbut-2-enyl diphosphate reductase/30S ribosomal protein S1 [Tissierella sp. Yu-01]WFA09723.1 bifunctional 4-hydroxy-3-methylbut-2-enyl diphosphate reductase/30S ribosomal protein S1 [Tissierella sp. Yu-01]
MEIVIAKNAGVCFGVKRALELAYEQSENASGKVYSYGPLVHNPQVVTELENRGVATIDEIDNIEEGNLIVRSHGVPKNIIDKIKVKNINLVDCTCPYVSKVHKKVEEYYNRGYDIIIIGDKTHPEVIGINGWCNNKAYIINSEEEANLLPYLENICVVSQTTNTLEKFDNLVEIIKNKANNINIDNTICNATKVRQESTADVAKSVEAMIVLGGKNSSNTRKLVEISKKYCNNVFHVETIKDLSLQDIQIFNTIGITAGASTPDWIIKEAVEAMDNLNKDEMMEAIESSFKRIHRGEIVKGTVLYVTDNEVMVNINYKSDGIIHRDELSRDPDAKPKDLFNVGDEINVYVLRIDDGEGNVVLSSKRVEDVKNWDVLEEAYNKKSEIDCKVLNAVKGGLTVLVLGINGFMPASHVSVNFVTDLSKFKGQTFKVRIIDFDKEKRRVVVSRKEVEREELDKKVAQLWGNLEVDTIIEGTVQRLTDFGAFVDLGGVDGLIHISDLSWNRVKHPSEVLKPGQKVEVRVLSLDKEKNRISLGLKQTIAEPWEVFINNVKVDDIVEGRIVNLLDFGAFVRLKEGVDGLLHVSQISKEHVNKPSDVLKIGETVKVKVIEINEEEKRISLSSKELDSNDSELSQIKNEDINTTIGDVIKEN